LPNGDVIEPDNCFIRAERMHDYLREKGLTSLPKSYPELVPDLVMECCCCTEAENDPSSYQKAKLQMLMEMGMPVGIFIEPEKERTVTLSQLGKPETVLRDGDVLTIPELLSGWELPISELWAD
jgi:Uma2 family endonuclease